MIIVYIIHRLFFLYIFLSRGHRDSHHVSVHILFNDKHEIKLEMVINVIRILYVYFIGTFHRELILL